MFSHLDGGCIRLFRCGGKSAARGRRAVAGVQSAGARDAGHVAYLGVSGKKEFAVGDIAAEVVIIEIFNMY